MPILPEIVSEAWEQREGPCVLGTVDSQQQPNIIYIGAIKKLTESTFVVADSAFHKTRANIANGSKGSLLFITKEWKAYQIICRIETLTSGELFDDLPNWVDPQYTSVAAVVLHVEEVFSGAEKLT